MTRPKNFPNNVGRPKLPRGTARSTTVNANVTKKTADKLKRMARLKGYHSRSAFIADLLIDAVEEL